MLFAHTHKTGCSRTYRKYVGGVLVAVPDDSQEGVEYEPVDDGDIVDPVKMSVRNKIDHLYNTVVGQLVEHRGADLILGDDPRTEKPIYSGPPTVLANTTQVKYFVKQQREKKIEVNERNAVFEDLPLDRAEQEFVSLANEWYVYTVFVLIHSRFIYVNAYLY